MNWRKRKRCHKIVHHYGFKHWREYNRYLKASIRTEHSRYIVDHPNEFHGIPLHVWYLYHEEGMQHVCPECGHVEQISQSELDVCKTLQPRGINMFSSMYEKVAPRIECVRCGFRNPYWMFCVRRYSKELTIADVIKNTFPKYTFDDKSVVIDSIPQIPRDNWIWNKLAKDFEGDTLDVIYLTPKRGHSRMCCDLSKRIQRRK